MFRQLTEKQPVLLVVGFFFLGLSAAWGLQAGHSVYAATLTQDSVLPISQTVDNSGAIAILDLDLSRG